MLDCRVVGMYDNFPGRMMCLGRGIAVRTNARLDGNGDGAGRAPARFGRRILRWVVGATVAIGLLATMATVQPAPAQLLAGAAQARASLRYDRALAWYAQAEAAAPNDPQPWCDAGDVLTLQREWAAAATSYRRCLQLDPGDGTAWLRYGDALADGGDATAAQAAWARASTAGDSRGLEHSALSDEAAGMLVAAQATWARLPAGDAAAQLHLGLLALANGDYGDATQHLHNAMAVATYRRQLTDQGFTPFLQSPPRDGSDLALLGYTFLAAGMPWFALAPLRSAVAAAPTDGKAHAILGWALWLTGARAEARQEIAAGLRLAPKYSFAQFAAAQVAAVDGDFPHALALCEKALRLDDSSAVAWLAASRIEVALHDYVAADLAATNAAKLSGDPSYSAALLQFYADLRFGLDDGRAQAAATLAIQRFPDNEPVRYLAGLIFGLVGRPTLSYYALQDALQLDPTDPRPYILLAHYADSEGSFVTAAMYLRIALALWPHGPNAADARALLASLNGFAV